MSLRPGWLARTLLLALAGFILLFATPVTAHAELTGRVLIVTSGATSKLLDEGLVRVRGELAAMGLSTEVRIEGGEPPAPANVSTEFQGALVFERFGDWLRIQAWNPAAPMPVTQWIDVSDPAVDAEVIAIRAVEALRAALLPYLRYRTEESAPAEPEKRTIEEPASPIEVAPAIDIDEVEPEPASRESRTAATAWLGPAFGFDVDPGAVHVGAQTGFAYGVPEISGSARFEVTRAKVPVRPEAGEVQVTRFGVLVDARTRFQLAERLEAYAALGGGIVHHRVEGIAAPGYSGQSSGHTSPALLAELGVLHWFVRRLGAYVNARGTIATDAPVVRVDRREVATLARPDIAFSSGVTLSLD